MAMDRWFIGGGAEHTPESARRLVYSSTSGAEGIGGATDLQVLPTTPTGPSVRVTIGSALIRSRYQGGETQTYMGTVYSQETVAVAPTGSSARSDLVVMRVEDPFAAGSPYSAPSAANIATAPYVFIRVISGVPANTTRVQSVPGHANDTAIALARIDIPANQGVVLSTYIKDLREVAVPKRSEVVFARPRVAADAGAQSNLGTGSTVAAGGEVFPGGGGFSNEFQVRIPEWATRMVVDAAWMGVSYKSQTNPGGRYWMEFGDEYRDHTWPDKKQWEFTTQQFAFGSVRSSFASDGAVTEWRLMDTRTVPAKLKGKLVTFAFKAGHEGAYASGNISMGALGGLGCRLTFAEEAVDGNSNLT